ncbi:MAG: hypothetical protein COA69_03100 [Robiginitomaculum sp.]|nr:MAG: hypothetical protein COA69_03100 [Robiginitomaculum sp.]
MKRIFTSLIAIGFVVIPATALAVPEVKQDLALEGATRIGRWCDTYSYTDPTLDYIIELWKLKDGKYKRLQIFKKEKDGEQPINVHSANRLNGSYRIHDDFGEYVRVASDGSLRMYDGDGFIRKARPVGLSTKAGECRVLASH